MPMSVMLSRLLLCFTTLVLALPCLALPRYQSTKLPFPAQIPDADHDMIKAVLALEVHQDSEDPNLYYYVPPFHVRQYTQGAASLMVHSEKVKQYAEATKILKEKQKFDPNSIPGYRERLQRAEDRINEAEIKLDDALAAGNQVMIDHFRQRIVERQKALADLKIEFEQEKKEWIRRFYENASFYLALTGFDVDLTQCKENSDAEKAIKEAAHQSGTSYGGFMSFNTYAGFTRAQLDALRAYKAKYASQVKVALLPLQQIGFKPLTETQYDPASGSKSSKIFTQIKGSGDYLGTAIVMDASLVGALGLSTHLGPFIVPVGLNATYKQQAEPFDAELNCDFSDGFTVNGRADVRDGLGIYDNDITNNMDHKDLGKGACNLVLHSGDKKSAEYVAMAELEKKFTDLHFNRTQLAYAEKKKYYDAVLKDIQQNRRSKDTDTGSLLLSFATMGLAGLAIEGLAAATDFHWHTNIQNVSNISEVKFNKRIVINSHETIQRELPTSLCLVYNIDSRAYDRCTEEELKQAKDMRMSMDEIANSEECKNASDPMECASRRDESGTLPGANSGNRQPRDSTVVREI